MKCKHFEALTVRSPRSR